VSRVEPRQALEQAFDELENLHQELLASYEGLETKNARLEQLQNPEVKLGGKPEPIPAHGMEGPSHGTEMRGLTASSTLTNVIGYVQHLMVGDANCKAAVQNLHAHVARLEDLRTAPRVVPYEEEPDELFG
jgi:hypothetical protein